MHLKPSIRALVLDSADCGEPHFGLPLIRLYSGLSRRLSDAR